MDMRDTSRLAMIVFCLIICVALICATILFLNGQVCPGIIILIIIGSSSVRTGDKVKEAK